MRKNISFTISIALIVSAAAAFAETAKAQSDGLMSKSELYQKACGYHCHRGNGGGDDDSGGVGDHGGVGDNGDKKTPAANEQDLKYNRKDYGGWIDDDKDCINTRHEVLASSSSISVTMGGTRGCQVVAGRWLGLYTGEIFTNPKALDIDHVVPLGEAHRSGAAAWPRQKKRVFANDEINLLPVKASVNRQKGDKDPSDWMPPDASFKCDYIARWVRVKKIWGLKFDADEAAKIALIKAECASR